MSPQTMFPENSLVVEELAEKLTSSVESKKWKEGRALANHLVKAQPGEARWWMIYALCMRRTGEINAAQQILLKAVALHRDNARIRYDLARYTCAAGRTGEAEEHLYDAIVLNRGVRDFALDGPDLKPIWDSIN